jgi:serine/threonine-protein kinase
VLLAPLGSGGSGRVWAAVRVGRLGFTKRMALKLLRHDKLGSRRAVQRFDREAQLGARLNHPNIRAVHDLNSDDGWPYMAMRWVETSLDELLQHTVDHRLPPDVACWIGVQCAAALAAAHAHIDARGVPCPIIHRDVAPGNILLSAEGHVLLADLAAPIDTDALGTSDTRFFGNIAYASPEALKEQALDGRSDVFSLGCVLYQVLSGVPPFVADNEHSLLFQVLEQGAIDLRERAPHVPEPVAAVVRRAMAREPERRFASADAMGTALRACVEQRSAFSLEVSSTSIIREALGERIRAREEAMHIAFQRFSASQSGVTDTLPIRESYESVAPQGGDTHGSVAVAPRSSGVAASRRYAPARTRGALLGLVALAVVLYLLRSTWRPALDEARRMTTDLPTEPGAARPEVHTRSIEPAPPPDGASVAPSVSTSDAPPLVQEPSPSAKPAPTKKPGPTRKAARDAGKTGGAGQASAEAAAAPPPATPSDPRASAPAAVFQIERTNPYKKPKLRPSDAPPAAVEAAPAGTPPP